MIGFFRLWILIEFSKIKVLQNLNQSYGKIDMSVLPDSGQDEVQVNLLTLKFGNHPNPIGAVSSSQFNIFWAWFAFQLIGGFVKFKQCGITAGIRHGCLAAPSFRTLYDGITPEVIEIT